MKKLLTHVCLCLFLGTTVSEAQEQSDASDLNVLYRRESAWGAKLHTQGFGLNYYIGLHKTADLKRVYKIEFVTMNHPKEVKSINPFFENAKSYKFGKLNYAGLLRASYGHVKTLNFKPFMGGVDVRYFYDIGLNAAILKPVYLSILYPTDVPYRYTVSDEKYDPDLHGIERIYGRASFFRGFDDLKLYPGISGRVGFSFEYGSQASVVRALSLGVALDAYLRNVPIMAFEQNTNYFATLFVGFHFGSREFY